MNFTFRKANGLIGMLLLVSASVSFASGSQESGQVGEGEQIRLSFRHIWVTEHEEAVDDIFQDVIEQYEEKYPNVKIDVEAVDQQTHREQKLKAEMVAGNPPDIFVLWGGQEMKPYVDGGRLLDLTSFLEANGMREEFVDLSNFTFEDRVYGLPLEGFVMGIYYNREQFNQHNVAQPETLGDLIDAVDLFNHAGLTPIALANKPRWPSTNMWHFFLDRFAGYDTIKQIQTGEESWVNSAYIEATEALGALVEADAFPEGANGLPYAQQGAMFMSGEAPINLAGSWDASRFDGDPEFAEKVGFMNFPAVEGGEGHDGLICAGFTFGLGFSANLSGEKKEAVLNFIKEAYSEETQQRYAYEAGRVPARSVQIDDKKVGPVFGEVLAALEAADGTFMAYDGLMPPSVIEAYYNAAQSVIAGEDARTTLEGVQRAQEEALDSGN